MASGYDSDEEWVEIKDVNGRGEFVDDSQSGGNDDPEIMELQQQMDETDAEVAKVTPNTEDDNPGLVGKIKKKWKEYKNDRALERKRLEGVKKVQEERLRKAKADVQRKKIEAKYTAKIENLNRTPSERFAVLKGKVESLSSGFSGGAKQMTGGVKPAMSMGRPASGLDSMLQRRGPVAPGMDSLLRGPKPVRGRGVAAPSVRVAPGLDSFLKPRGKTGSGLMGGGFKMKALKMGRMPGLKAKNFKLRL